MQTVFCPTGWQVILHVHVFLCCVKTRAGLVFVEHVVSHHQGLRIPFLQVLYQQVQRLLLSVGACVGRSSLRIQSALVADAYRVPVVSLAVCAGLGFWPPHLHGSASPHYVVVSYALPSLGTVPQVYLSCRRALLRLYSGAVQDYQCYRSHRFQVCLQSHAGGYAKGGGNGSEDGDCNLKNLFPNSVFHGKLNKVLKG